METAKRACEFFDAVKGIPMSICPQETALQEEDGCFHWMNNYNVDDVFAPCRNNGEPHKDDKTVDMFNCDNNGGSDDKVQNGRS